MQEMDCLAVDLGQELWKLIHPRLLRAPIESGPPVVDHVLQVGHGSTEHPVVVRRRNRIPGQRQTGLEIVEVSLRDLDTEGVDGELVCGHLANLGSIPAQFVPVFPPTSQEC